MENNLEQLLNSLIEKGYIPFNIPCITDVSFLRRLWITSHQNDRDYKFDFSLRDLVSKWSWLWQFVCENGMVDMENKRPANYQYRLIESSLKDENELEDFLLNSISLHE